MRAVSVALACSLIPSLAIAEDDTTPEPVQDPTVDTKESPVIGGDDAPLGKWPDTAAILFNGQQQCTGTLIAPTVALTAGHCNDTTLKQILVGTNNLRRPLDGGGEVLDVVKRVKLQENDTTVLVLDKASKIEPRALATGWATFDVKNGAKVQLVGYGTINEDANQGTDTMQEAETTITDFNCSVKPGCDNFEIGAGGMGIDTCPGDSGGPMYLKTAYGDFLIGVTSRAYANARNFCGEGGIYGRPDQIVDVIEAAAGVPVKRGPEPALDADLLAIRGDAAESSIIHNDPKAGAAHTFAITTQPMKGQAAVNANGTLRVCVAQDAVPGDTDSLVVTVTDSTDPTRSVAKRFKISVAANDPNTDACDPMAFGSDDGGGCCDSGGQGAGGSALLALIGLVALRRRRR
jgi:endonuclease G